MVWVVWVSMTFVGLGPLGIPISVIIQPRIIFIVVVICNPAYIKVQLLEIKWAEASKEICGFNAIIMDCTDITIYLIDYVVFSVIDTL